VQSFDLHVWPYSFVFTNSTSGPHVSTQSKSSHINLNLFNRPNAQVIVVGENRVSYRSQPPKGTTWKQKYIDAVRPDIADADWARVHFAGRISYDKFIAALQISRAHIYLTYLFLLIPGCGDQNS
jgi:hypothetical protein